MISKWRFYAPLLLLLLRTMGKEIAGSSRSKATFLYSEIIIQYHGKGDFLIAIEATLFAIVVKSDYFFLIVTKPIKL